LWMMVLALSPFAGGMAQSVRVAEFSSDTHGGPSVCIEFDGRLWFTMHSPTTGRELWVSDGTPTGTYQFMDIFPGLGSAFTNYFELKTHVMDGVLYFHADNGTHGAEPWRTDGTVAGTYMLRDCVPGSGSSAFGDPVDLNGNLYFLGSSGNTLWRSDGTEQGTTALYSFQIARGLSAIGNFIVFSAAQNNEGEELWRHNTANGTTSLVLDLNGANGASLPINFHRTPNRLYFMASTQSGWELWRTNGTSGGTTMVKDINPGSANGALQSYSTTTLASMGDTVYFRATDGATGFQLWRSDGTDAGTWRVSSLADAVLPEIGFPIVNGKVLYSSFAQSRFHAYDPTTDQSAITTYPSHYYFNNIDRYRFVDDVLVHISKDSAYGCEVMWDNGIAFGYTVEADMTDNWSPVNAQSFNRVIGKLGTRVLFTAGRSHLSPYGPLWSFDVSTSGQCQEPQSMVAINSSATTTHLVWDRTPQATQYEVRYRIATQPTWTSMVAPRSYTQLNNLTTATAYEAQVRAYCNSTCTDWSDTVAFTSGLWTQNDYLDMVAERAEDATTMRLYWLPSEIVVSANFRYRPYGTTTWQSFTNNTGYRRIQNLLPGTLYEYQSRFDLGSGYTEWPLSSRYFLTDDVATSIPMPVLTSNGASVYPVPTTGSITITDSNGAAGTARVIDASGRTCMEVQVSGPVSHIDLSPLPDGLYLISSGIETFRIIKTKD